MRIEWYVCGLLAVVVGCNGEKEGDLPDPSAPGGGDARQDAAVSDDEPAPKGPMKPWDPSLGTTTVNGVVRFAGEPPKRRKLDMSSDAACCRITGNPGLDEIVVVSPDGTLKNVFVWVKRGLEGWEFPLPTEPAVLDQKGCMFHPHVLGVRVGQPVKIRNSDPVFHNVHAFPTSNSVFNFSQAQQGMEETRTFKRVETMIPVKCDIHGWMSNYINVVPNPYFAVTADDGVFEFTNLPPGEFTIEAVHEYLGKQSTKMTVMDGQSAEIEFSFQER